MQSITESSWISLFQIVGLPDSAAWTQAMQHHHSRTQLPVRKCDFMVSGNVTAWYSEI